MNRENQRMFSFLNALTDAFIVFAAMPVSYWLWFIALPWGTVSVPFSSYVVLGLALSAAHVLTYLVFGLYRIPRGATLGRELGRLWSAGLLDMALLLSFLFLQHREHYSRMTMAIFLLLSMTLLSVKRAAVRVAVRRLRREGYNQKHVALLGGGEVAKAYLHAIKREPEQGYRVSGYVAERKIDGSGVRYLGGFDELDDILSREGFDEVVSAIDMDDYHRMPQIIAACEKSGTKLSIVPFYARYMPSNPQIDRIGGVPLINLRRIPLDNVGNAMLKRGLDILCSLLLIVLSSPVMLLCALGVRLSSPGPIIFKQERVGLNKKNFYMYKFRSMRVNAKQDSGWSGAHDDRRTKFGSFIRKFSLDELPQFFNVLKGDMSLVGPRPESPYFVEQFKEEVPLYMVKHQVRPGITGWAQVNGFRGDTSIRGRIEHDIYYIEHWTFLFDLKILFMTVFGGKFVNSESLK